MLTDVMGVLGGGARCTACLSGENSGIYRVQSVSHLQIACVKYHSQLRGTPTTKTTA